MIARMLAVKPMKEELSAEWPVSDLESIAECPVCGGHRSVLAHEGVADWSFWSAPGAWQYWQCSDCESMYLNPRPSAGSIGRAYSSYYTHAGPGAQTGIKSLKIRWKNERLSARFGRSIEPRLHLPALLHSAVARRGKAMALPFGWQELADMAPGRLMDVGCGSGATLALGKQLGWDVQGLEMDKDAVLSARAAGLRVGEGGYERLADSPSAFDGIICSHVIEHVFDPVDMLRAMYAALKPGGALLLATPNVWSDVHLHFGKYWRGLEAPRHLVLFSETSLTRQLREQGFEVTSRSDQELATVCDSVRIARGGTRVNSADRAMARRLTSELPRTSRGQDFIKLVAHKR